MCLQSQRNWSTMSGHWVFPVMFEILNWRMNLVKIYHLLDGESKIKTIGKSGNRLLKEVNKLKNSSYAIVSAIIMQSLCNYSKI